MRIAAITMVYNEAYFLPAWLHYYSRQLGWENLYVVDHGSTDGSVDPKSCNRICVPRFEVDEGVRAEMMSKLHACLLACFDVVIYTDVDEFIVPRPSKYNGLVDYCQKRAHSVSRCAGFNVFQHDSRLPQLDLTAPILHQRPYGYFTYWLSKPLISSVPVNWCAGFHSCDKRAYLDPNLVLFRLKFADLTHVFDRLKLTRSLPWSDAHLKAGYAPHHLWSEEKMRHAVAHRQQTMSNKDMDSIRHDRVFKTKNESPYLVQITDDYLAAL